MEVLESMVYILDFLSILLSVLFFGMVGLGLFISGGWVIIWIVTVIQKEKRCLK